MALDIKHILEIENDSRILEFRYKYKDTLVWPFIRYAVLNFVVENTLQSGNMNPPRLGYSTQVSTDINKYILKKIYAFIKNPFFSIKKPIMFFYGCTGNVYDEKGRIYNRIFDDFVKVYGDNTYVLDCTDRDLMKKSQVKKHYSCMVDSLINIMVENTKDDIRDTNMVNQFLKYLREKIPANCITSAQMKAVKSTLLAYSKKIKYQDIFYGLLFQLVNPKVVFIEDGCYGERNAYICKLLHERGIAGAEIQHGAIGKKHYAYNFGEIIRTSDEYKKYLPDYFCGMSDSWIEQINAPIEKISFGNPAFYRQYNKLYKISKQEEIIRNQKTILWLGFNDNRQTMEILNSFLQASGSKYKVIIRLHPLLYKKYSDAYKEMCRKYTMLIIDDNSMSHSIYDSFIKCDYVVSDVSTAIYEAIEFGKQVFIYKNKSACYYETTRLGETFASAQELLELLYRNSDCDDAVVKKKENCFFDMRWKENYKAFIRTVCK